MTRMPWLALSALVLSMLGCATLTREEIASRGNLGDRRALVAWLGDERSWVREEAARAMGRSRDRESRELLEARLFDRGEKTWVRSAAAEALGQLGELKTLPLFAGLAVQPDTPPEVKLALIRAMCAFPGDEPLSAIAPLAANEDLLVASLASAQLASSCGKVSR